MISKKIWVSGEMGRYEDHEMREGKCTYLWFPTVGRRPGFYAALIGVRSVSVKH